MASAKKSRTNRPKAKTTAAMVVVASGEEPLDQVARKLKRAGFKVDQVLHGIGQITGRATPALRDRLRKIDGVAEVSQSHEDFNIGPPDSKIS